jgi:hypothetical protein
MTFILVIIICETTFILVIIIYKTTFILIIAVCTRYSIIQCSVISYTHVTVTYIHGVVFSLSPSQFPLLPLPSLFLPFVPLSTYLAPSSCDRNRPPSSQVACKLTLFAPPFTQLFHPFQLPRNPTAQRLTTTTLGPLRSYYAEHLGLGSVRANVILTHSNGYCFVTRTILLQLTFCNHTVL